MQPEDLHHMINNYIEYYGYGCLFFNFRSIKFDLGHKKDITSKAYEPMLILNLF